MKKIFMNFAIPMILAVLLIAGFASYEPAVITDHPEHGLIVIDAGEWGEVLPYTPSAPTPQPTSSTEPTITPLECEGPTLKWVVVSGDKAPLREIKNYNPSGRPVFTIFGGSIVSNRYVPRRGKIFCVYSEVIFGDGGNHTYRIPSSQTLGGKPLPGDQWLYVLTRQVSGSQAP